MSNLLWLKAPHSAPDLPRKLVIADCFAALQPDERLWGRYLQEIDKLEEQGSFDSDDCYLLRCSAESKNFLMDVTLGDEDAFTEGTVAEVLERFKARERDKVRAAVEAERATAAQALEEERRRTAGFEELECQRRAALRSRSVRWARLISWVSSAFVVGILLFGILVPFPHGVPSDWPTSARFVASGLSLMVLLGLMANLVFGTTVTHVRRAVETHAGRWILTVLLRLTAT